MKGPVPDATGFAFGLEAEFESHSAKNQTQQHENDGNVEGRHENRVGQGKGGKKAPATQYQPGFIPVPERSDGVHHTVAALIGGGHREQDAHP